MQAPLYANAEDISSRNYKNPSLRPENRLHLLPEHIAQIATAFIKQLTLAPLKSREIRILITIYSQTVGHNKREDDMNGRCLELLTGIRGDHANEAVRRLAALGMVITRQGTYGKWMSINFNFENWGKAPTDTQTNEPNVLLSDDYQAPTVDEEADDTVFQMHLLSTSSVTATAHSVVKKAPSQTLITEAETVIPNDKTRPASPAKPVVAVTPSDAFSINYPQALPKPLCQKIAGIIHEISGQEHAQRLVDYFANRLQTGTVRRPFDYFISLKNRVLKGQFYFSEVSSTGNTAPPPQKSTVDPVLPSLEAEYQSAMADYQSVKKSIEGVSQRENCAFDAAFASIGYTQIWQKAVARVDKISNELKLYQQKNPKKPSVSATKEKTVTAKRTRHESPQFIGDLLNSLQLAPSSL